MLWRGWLVTRSPSPAASAPLGAHDEAKQTEAEEQQRDNNSSVLPQEHRLAAARMSSLILNHKILMWIWGILGAPLSARISHIHWSDPKWCKGPRKEGLHPEILESNGSAREEIQPHEPRLNEACVGGRGERNKQRREDVKHWGARGNLKRKREVN